MKEFRKVMASQKKNVKKALCALQDKKFQASNNSPMDAATKVEYFGRDLMSEVTKANEKSIEKMTSNVERSERSGVYKESTKDELVMLADEIQKSVDLVQELLVKLQERKRQMELKNKELARRKSEEEAFAADKKKWQSLNEDQVSVASFSSIDMDGTKMSQTFSPITVEKQISHVTPDTDDPKVIEPSNSETQ